MASLLRPLDTCYSYITDCYVHGTMVLQATNLIDEFNVKVEGSVIDGKTVWKAERNTRRNGLSLDAGEYKRIFGTLSAR